MHTWYRVFGPRRAEWSLSLGQTTNLQWVIRQSESCYKQIKQHNITDYWPALSLGSWRRCPEDRCLAYYTWYLRVHCSVVISRRMSVDGFESQCRCKSQRIHRWLGPERAQTTEWVNGSGHSDARQVCHHMPSWSHTTSIHAYIWVRDQMIEACRGGSYFTCRIQAADSPRFVFAVAVVSWRSTENAVDGIE